MADDERQLTSEEAPLLGERGDASQPDGRPSYYNLFLGTGTVAQAGAWILVAIVWGSIFSNDLILFSTHPLLNSAAMLFFVQGILIIQPTHTAKQKKQGTYTHAALNDVALGAALAGLILIEYNKIKDGNAHFESPHAILGLVTYVMIVLQFFVGVTQYFTPGLYGGEDNAQALYKYHRAWGYLTLLVMLATICAATQTTFNKNVLHMKLWTVIVAVVVIIVGIAPRTRLSKFGWMSGK